MNDVAVERSLSSRGRAAVAGCLIAILAIAAAVRVYDLTHYALWLDEFFTLEASAGHGLEHRSLFNAGAIKPPDLLSLQNGGPWWSAATTLARDDNHPPLYFLLIRFWREAFGSADVTLRAFSILTSLVAVVLMFDVARLLHGPAAGLWAALLMSLAQPQIHYAQEGRAYSLLIALLLAACGALVRIELDGPTRRRLIALGAFVLAMMLTHYYAFAPAMAIGLYVLLRLRGPARRDAVLALVFSGFVFALVWGWGVYAQRGNISGNNWWIRDYRPGHAWRTLMRIALLPMRSLNDPLLRAEPFAAAGIVLYFVPFLMLRKRPDLLLWGLLLCLPVAQVAATDFARSSRQLEFLRYTLCATPAVYAMVAAIAPANRKWMRHALPAAGALSCILSLPQTYAWPETPKPDWRVLAATLDKSAQPSDVVIFYSKGIEDTSFIGQAYIAIKYYSHRFPANALFLVEPPDAEQLVRLRKATAVWLIYPEESPMDVGLLPGFKSELSVYTPWLPRLERWRPPDAAQ